MDLTHIRRIVDALTGSAAAELRLSSDGMDLHVRFVDTVAPTAADAAAHHSHPAQKGTLTVPAPMPGTVYLAPSPSAQPFVAIGDRVGEGDTLLLIEAMKSMQPITAPSEAVVEEVLIADEETVEMSQPLIRLRPVST